MTALVAFAATVSLASCKGNSDKSTSDTGQTHVGNAGPADTTSLPTTPTETGGKDSSGNGQGNTNMPKDTLQTNP